MPFPGAVTTSVAAMDLVVEVPVPTTLKLYVPVAVEEPTLTVMVEAAPAVTDAGLNDAVAPAGSPLAENVTVCAAPLVTCVDTE